MTVAPLPIPGPTTLDPTAPGRTTPDRTTPGRTPSQTIAAPVLTPIPALVPDAARGLRRVFIHGLVLDAGIGVYAHEQGVSQRLVVGLEILAEEGPTGSGGVGEDRLTRVVDYDRLAEAARAAVRDGHVRLIETLAERIAAGVLAADPRVVRTVVTVEKPGAVPDAVTSGVSVERLRGAAPLPAAAP